MAGLIDTSIIRPELSNALAAGYQQAEDRRNLLAQQQQQRQLADLQLQNALREQRLAGEEEAAWKTGAGNPQAVLKQLQERGLGKQAMALQAQIDKSQADRVTMMKNATELMKSAANSIFTNPTFENAVGTVQAFGQRTGMDVSRDLQELQRLGNNPEAIKQWAAGHAISADKLLPKFQEVSTPGGGKQIGTVTPLTAQFTATTTMAPQATPGEIMAHQDRLARLSQETATGSWSPDSVEFAAQTYAQTGQMPPVGMGARAMAVRDKILQRASEIARGVNVTPAAGQAAPEPVDMATAAGKVAGAKQTKAAEAAAVRDFSAGMSGRRVTANNTAINHLESMEKLASDLNNSDVRVVNAASTAFAKATGAPAPTNFDAARQLVAAEVIKAVVANGGGVKEREEAAEQFARANSPSQLKGVIETYKELLAGQLDSLGLQYESSTGRKDFESKLTPATKKVFNTIRAKSGAPADKAGRTVTRTGTLNGRKVIEYSDGSVEYGN